MEKDLDGGYANMAADSASVSSAKLSDDEKVTRHKQNSIEHGFISQDLWLSATHHSHQISLSAVEPVDVQVCDLALSVDTSPTAYLPSIFSRKRGPNSQPNGTAKDILHGVSANMPHGTLTAILGGSGSGKTSMLNTMAERMKSGRLSKSGTTTFNRHQGIQHIRSAYVMQQDILLPSLTVRETLQYSADLRLPPPTTAAERKQIVEEVILELGLKECADTRIGNNVHKGCSGGEKRRTSIGVQLLSNPSVLFLDEPTTGLDATSAFQVVRTLKGLAQKGRTVVTTIHQPRSEIWGLFDNLVILTRGSPIYSGPKERCIPYFKKHGLELPPFVNPAEFVIDIAAIDNRSAELEVTSNKRVQALKDTWLTEGAGYSGVERKNIPASGPPMNSKATLSDRQSTFSRQLQVLTARTLKVTYRDSMGMFGSLLEALVMGVIMGWIFLQLGEDQAGIRSREGALYSACSLQGYLILIYEIYRLTIDIELFDRERGEGVVGVVPFLLSRRVARFWTEDLPVPLIYSVLFYWMAGFRADAGQFFTFFAVLLLNHYISICFATTCVAVDRSFAGASLIGNLGYTVQSMACGYFLQSNAIPVYVRWLKWTAYVFYSFGALCANEFVGHFYDCPFAGGESNPECAQYTGAYILNSLGFPSNWIIRPIIILVGYVLMFYIIAGFTLKYWKMGMKIGKARNSDTDLSAGKEKMTARSAAEVRQVDITLEKFSLDLDKRSWLGKKLPTKTILQPITTRFQAGMLNVIMGPSGSGKTSLLNAMALRLHNNVGTQYHPSGKLMFNGAVPSDPVIRSVCSYVCQDDDALLASLTVRETLRFAAGLRLPSYMTKEEKYSRAEEVLLKMGLKDCADNLIGNDLVKGISGGEKRRVTIAVQILTDPRVLLLDEPTSGLDAFTASSILDVLQGLALDGRTLILTIHQSRSDLFKHFGSVLLLARGGSPVYGGAGKGMLPYFDNLGFTCPVTTNPADFALDLITVDLQQVFKEEASRDRVNSLVTSWAASDISSALSSTTIATPAQLGALKRSIAPFTKSYPILVQRSVINLRRQPDLFLARIMQVVGLGIIYTLFFAPLKFNYYSIQNRFGFIQEFCGFYFVGMLQNIVVYPLEQAVFYREHDDHAYSVEAFFVQYVTVEVPFEILSSFIFAILADLAVGLPRTATVFFVCFFNCFCIVNCGESLGIMVSHLLSVCNLKKKLTTFSV